MVDPHIRIGDPERLAAIARLDGFMRAGQLTPEEFSLRVERIRGCRTHHELEQAMVGFHPPAGVQEPHTDEAIPGQTSGPVGLADTTQAGLEIGELGTPGNQGPGWYEVIDPWDSPMGSSPLTLRKARRIGWVLAIAMSLLTVDPLLDLVPSAFETVVFFFPLLCMTVLSFMMAPNTPKTYRWVPHPHDDATPGAAVPSPGGIPQGVLNLGGSLPRGGALPAASQLRYGDGGTPTEYTGGVTIDQDVPDPQGVTVPSQGVSALSDGSTPPSPVSWATPPIRHGEPTPWQADEVDFPTPPSSERGDQPE